MVDGRAVLVAAVAAAQRTKQPPADHAFGDCRLSFRVPKDGGTTLPLVEPEIDLWVDDHRGWMAAYGATAQICCDLDGASIGCDSLDSTRIPLPKQLPLGAHALTCELLDFTTGASLLVPDAPASTRWTVVATAEETAEGARLVELYYEDRGQNEALRRWWRGDEAAPPWRPRGDFAPWAAPPSGGALLVVGVKCAAGALEQRDAMRRTWFSDANPGEVQARFVVGRAADGAVAERLRREQATYGDLLIPETGLDLEDGYTSLVPKTKAFARFAHRTFPEAAFVMLVDDDVLVDLPKLLAAVRGGDAEQPALPRSRFYAGQVWATHFNQPKLPQRDPSHRNFLPEATYPMSQLPPFAIGPHYLMSMDCAAFIDANLEVLAGVGTLEDVSVALWLLALQVHPQHSEQFINARLFGCMEGAVSVADLTARGIRAMHANRGAGRPDCDGYEELAWVKVPRFRLTEETLRAELR